RLAGRIIEEAPQVIFVKEAELLWRPCCLSSGDIHHRRGDAFQHRRQGWNSTITCFLAERVNVHGACGGQQDGSEHDRCQFLHGMSPLQVIVCSHSAMTIGAVAVKDMELIKGTLETKT